MTDRPYVRPTIRPTDRLVVTESSMQRARRLVSSLVVVRTSLELIATDDVRPFTNLVDASGRLSSTGVASRRRLVRRRE